MKNLPVSIGEFKDFFNRDFLFGNDEDSEVTDSDINRAMREAKMNFNEGIFNDKEEAQLIFMYLTAYYLTVDATNRNGGSTVGLLTSRTVRNVSESFAVPEWVKTNPIYSQFAQNGYGLKYLTMIYPYTIGYMTTVSGGTLA